MTISALGWASAEMYAVALYNQREGSPVRMVSGVVTRQAARGSFYVWSR